jgi:hypothetical protein
MSSPPLMKAEAEDKLCRGKYRHLRMKVGENPPARHSSASGINRKAQRRRPPGVARRRHRPHRRHAGLTPARIAPLELETGRQNGKHSQGRIAAVLAVCLRLSQKLPDWIDAQVRALHFFGGVPKAIVCDNLKAAVAKPLWFERYSRANTGITCARATRSRASSPPSDIGPCTTRERCRRRRRS